MKTILVTGGAGYIGSVTVRRLRENGYDVVVLDNLSRGNKDAVPGDVPLIAADISAKDALDDIFTNYSIDAVMHFAAFAYVGESVENPILYFENNLEKSIRFFHQMQKHGVKNIIFSSTCAVYGVPSQVPITETEKKKPINPYGLTKSLIEEVLEWHTQNNGLASVSLRYFNAAGAAYGIGEDHKPEAHLIPLVLQVALGQRDSVNLFGTDYPTPDGTCIRDYIHVLDLADAHILALKSLEEGKAKVYNLGTGTGHSVNEVIDMCRAVTMHQIPTKVCEQRQGDPPMLVASAKKIEEELDWKPQYSLSESIASAWDWHRKNPDGYA